MTAPDASLETLKRSAEFEHYCAVCTFCLADAFQTCPECGSQPPGDGWPSIRESGYQYLGGILDSRYLLDRFLGDGATGFVYRARALQIHRQFAAKIVDTRRYKKPEFERELLRRFRLEVDAMSQLRNPHVVAIYEAMQLSEGLFVLVMDYVDGRTLQALLDRVGRVKLDRTLELIRQVANGLYEAHRVGFIHRDLKPDNIMVERLPASGFFARILDFGIVHVMGDVGATQGFRGTPLYASPEQCVGDPNIDHRSDIYSLGCVLFHCLTGQPPFPGSESLPVMDAHVNDAPPRLKDVLGEGSVPDELEVLMASLLAKDPADRPDDLSAVIREIDNVIRQTKPRPRRPSAPGKVEAGRAPSLGNAPEDRKLGTGDFPAVNPALIAPGSRTSVLSPLLELTIPSSITSTGTAYTAASLGSRAEYVALADQSARVHVLGLKNNGFHSTYSGAEGLVTAVFVDSDRNLLVAAQMGGEVLQWPLDDASAKPEVVMSLPDRIYALSSSTSKGCIICGTDRGRVVSLQQRTGEIREIVASGPAVSAVVCPNTEAELLVGYWGGSLELVQSLTGERRKFGSSAGDIRAMVVSPDGYVAAVLDESSNVRILSVVDGRTLFTVPAAGAQLRSLAFAVDGELLGLSLQKTTLQLWEIHTARPRIQ